MRAGGASVDETADEVWRWMDREVDATSAWRWWNLYQCDKKEAKHDLKPDNYGVDVSAGLQERSRDVE